MKKFLKEFRDFAIKGNMISMAIGLVIGSSFTALVAQINESLITPLLSIFLENGHLDTLTFSIGGGTFAYGKLVQGIINFVITAFILFLIVKGMNKVNQLAHPVPPAPTTKKCPYCLSEVSVKASRCPHCTSELEETSIEN